MFFLVTLTLGYPSNMIDSNKRFPSSRDDNFMGLSTLPSGVYDSNLISEGSVTCDRSLYMVGFLESSLSPSRDYGYEKRYISNTPGTFTVSGDTFDVLCANSISWSYASLRNNEKIDILDRVPETFDASADVIIVGAGVGGLSTGYALREKDVSVLVIGNTASTTSISTGVSFFPDESYPAKIVPDQKIGGYDDTMMRQWCSTAKSSLLYWEERLKLIDYELPTFKPKDYFGDATDRIKIVGPPICDLPDCGAALTAFLGANLEIRNEVIPEVYLSPTGDFIQRSPSSTYKARSVVIATGGNGKEKYPNSCHAISLSNLGLETAASLGLATAGENNCYYLPHLDLGEIREEWFSMTDCVPDCGDVNVCDNYNIRGKAMAGSNCSGTAANFSSCNDEAVNWRNLLQSYDPSIPLFSNESCADLTFIKGVIDCKGSFKLNADFASLRYDRLYASGTTASAFTGDTYLAPGATIGLGLHTGFMNTETLPGLSLKHI